MESWLNILAARWTPLKPKDGKRGTDSRLEDVVRLSAEYCEHIAEVEGTKEVLSLASLEIPNFRYFPTHLLEKRGPKQWARLRILQACERLDIPQKLRPKFPFPELPRPQYHHYLVSGPLSLPSYFPLYESEGEWKAKAQRFFDEFVERELERFKGKLKYELEQKTLTPIRQTRETTPLGVRYEWAAKRICYRMPYRELAEQEAANGSKGHSEERIRQAVAKIIREADWRQVK
ncbi:MAG TPA: hypothetical protein VMB25_23465 [Bryobacteraceae bacterium]|nr:hypothetical protein [Bryobacteraceae bacterium]